VNGVLVVNAGSTSVKLSLFAEDDVDEPGWSETVNARSVESDRVEDIVSALRDAPIDLDAVVDGVGHRIVHGGDRFDRPVVVDDEVEAAVASIAHLAPLHNQAGLDGIAAARRVVRPDVSHVAVFDTAFHRTMPMHAAAYGGPFEWLESGLRRYGFHGISHEYAADRAALILGRSIADLRLVTCHLGGGCSLAAVAGGRSVDTTMGFTPLDGLVMATRCGALDPGLVLHLLRERSTLADVERVLERESGLLGLSGRSADLREVVAAREQGDTRAALAVDVFVYRVATNVGAMVAALGGIDALVFTGGIGEHSSEVRERVSAQLAFLGVRLDEARNRSSPVDGFVSPPDAAVPVVVVRAREDLMIARAVRAVARSVP
jgi:acetate kinase